jgi:hypothetical protein
MMCLECKRFTGVSEVVQAFSTKVCECRHLYALHSKTRCDFAHTVEGHDFCNCVGFVPRPEVCRFRCSNCDAITEITTRLILHSALPSTELEKRKNKVHP